MSQMEIEAAFGATKGLPGYSSERSDLRVRIVVDLEGESIPDWLNEATYVEDILRNHLVFGVAEALGMEAALSEGGKASLVWPVDPVPGPVATQQVQQQAASQPPPQGGGGGGGGQHGPPKASKEEVAALPRVHLDMGDGTGLKVYIDQRPLKAGGKYLPSAPDFKVDEPNGKGYWIKQQNGTENYNVRQAMTNAGVI